MIPKVSLATGLIYTYTNPPSTGTDDPWYWTALDFRTGKTVYKVLAGNGSALEQPLRRDQHRPGRDRLPRAATRAAGGRSGTDPRDERGVIRQSLAPPVVRVVAGADLDLL